MNRFTKGLLNAVAVILTLAVVFGIGFFAGKIYVEKTSLVDSSTNEGFDLHLPGEVEKMVVTAEEVEAKILEIGELTSCEGFYTVTKGKDFTRYILDNIPVPGTTNHVELTCTGVVKAGYDLEDIVVKVDENSKTIYVSLPSPKVNSNQLMWDDSMLFNEKNNILNPIDFEQYQSLISEIKEDGLKEAEKQGLYKTVEQNAKNLITNFLGCFDGYKVVFM